MTSEILIMRLSRKVIEINSLLLFTYSFPFLYKQVYLLFS